MSKRPPIERVYWTAALGPMAVARRDGGIGWSEQWADQRGILLWEDVESAADWAIGQWGRPTVVVEIERGAIDTSLLERVSDRDLARHSSDRMWIYPQAIEFGRVRWHTYREDLVEPARAYTVIIPGTAEPDRDLPTGTITLDT